MRVTEAVSAIKSSDLVEDKLLWQTLRYVCAPRVSEEDLWTFVGKKFKNVPKDAADLTAKVLSDLERNPIILYRPDNHRI